MIYKEIILQLQQSNVEKSGQTKKSRRTNRNNPSSCRHVHALRPRTLLPPPAPPFLSSRRVFSSSTSFQNRRGPEHPPSAPAMRPSFDPARRDFMDKLENTAAGKPVDFSTTVTRGLRHRSSKVYGGTSLLVILITVMEKSTGFPPAVFIRLSMKSCLAGSKEGRIAGAEGGCSGPRRCVSPPSYAPRVNN